MEYSKKYSAIEPSITLAISAKEKKMKSEGIDIIGFSVGEPDFKTPENIRKKAIDSIESWNNQYHRYLDYPKIDYTIISSFVDDSSNVEVCLDSQKNDSDSVLKVQQLTSGNSYDEVAKYSDNFNLYDISFYKNNEKVTIDGTAIVKIPVKEGMDGNKCKVYYNDNGKFTDMNAVYKDGHMEFETTHFSEYALVEGSLPTLTMGDVNGDGKVNVLDAVMVLRHDANIIKSTLQILYERFLLASLTASRHI